MEAEDNNYYVETPILLYKIANFTYFMYKMQSFVRLP